jgi:hypothetical protein
VESHRSDSKNTSIETSSRPVEKISLNRKEALHDSLPYTAEDLEQLLFGRSSRSENQKISHTLSNEGSGQLLGWQAFMGNENCFVNKVPEKPSRIKILISSALLNDRPPFSGELPFFSALIEHYEVYLYEGRETNLLAATPLTNANEFWEKRDKIKPATVSQIQNDFAEQHLSTSQWVFFTHTKYMEIWGCPRWHLDLTDVSLMTQEEQKIVLQSVYPSEIKRVDLFAPRPETLEFILKYFKNLKTISLKKVSASWLKKNIHYFKGTAIKSLIIEDFVYNLDCARIGNGDTGDDYSMTSLVDITLPSVYGIKNLVIPNLNEDLCAFVLSLPETENLKLFIREGPLVDKAKFQPGAAILPNSELFTRIDEKLFNEECASEDDVFSESVITKSNAIEISTGSQFEALIASGECKRIVSLYIHPQFNQNLYNRIKSINEYFPALKYLDIKITQSGLTSIFLDKLIISNLPFLEYLNVETGCNIILNNLPKLLKIVANCNILKINSSFPLLKYLTIDINELSFNKEYFPEVERVTLHGKIYCDNKKIILPNKIKTFLCNADDNNVKIITNKSLRNLHIQSLEQGPLIVCLNNSDQLQQLEIEGYVSKDYLRIEGLHTEKLLLLEGMFQKGMVHYDTLLPNSVITTIASSSEHSDKRFSVWTHINQCEEDEKSIRPASSHNTHTNIIGVSYFSLNPTSCPSIPTGNMIINDGEGDFKAYLSDGSDKPISVRDYRIQIYDQIELQDDDRLVFSSTPLDVTELEYSIITNTLQQRQIFSNSQINTGIFEGTLMVGHDYPLPLTGPVTQNEFFKIYQQYNTPGIEISFYLDTHRKQYFVRLLKAPKNTANVKLFYDFTIEKNYRSEIDFEPAEMKNSLSAKLSEAVKKELNDNPELDFLFDETLTRAQKISQLKVFCRFNDEPLQASVKDGTFSALLAFIKERRGVCQQRAHAFMLLSRFIGVDVHMIGNETHLYCEVRTLNGTFAPIELGGGIIRNDLQTNRHPSQLLQALPNNPLYPNKLLQPFPNNPLSTLLPLPDVKDNMYEQPRYSVKSIIPDLELKKYNYESAIRSHFTVYPPFDWALFKNSLKPVLIYLSDDILANTIRHQYFKKSQLPDVNEDYLYIDSPLDFKRYGETYRLEDKNRIPVKGLLSNILEKGGTLLINWSNFSYDEKMSYSSLWASSPRLKDQPIKNPIKIIGFLYENIPCPPTFLSKSLVCNLPIFPLPEIKEIPEVKETIESKDSLVSQNEPIHVDLFEGVDWYEKLVGEITFDKGHYTIKEGPLLEAIRTKRPLIIHRPPNNKLFNQFLEDIQIDKRFLFNAEWKNIQKEISIEISKEPSPQTILAMRSDISIKYVSHNSEVKGEKVYLTLNNTHTIYKELEFDLDDKTVSTKPGKLEQQHIHKKPIVFYVADNIPAIEWEQIIVFIFQHYPKTPYTFQFAPGISGPGINTSYKIVNKLNKKLPYSKTIIESIKMDLKKDQLSRCYVSNDPNYLAEKLYETFSTKKSPYIIDLTPQLSATDLLVKIKINKSPITDEKTKNKALRFDIKTGILFNALESGKTVILKGEISKNIMQELLPLFSDIPYLEFNRKRIPISGRLIVIQPIKTNYLSSVISTIPCNFSFEDYRIDLLSLHSNLLMLDRGKLKEKNDMFDKLFLFFLAATYPHRGRSMPADLGVTWERLSDMWRSLSEKTPLDIAHRHNPFKENMLYDYDKYGEYYAFLNVISKFLFDNTLEKCDINLKKYHLLPENVKNTQTINWFLLNTCNGKKLREILGERWLINIIQQKKYDLSMVVKNNALTEAQWLLVRDKLNKSVNEMNAEKLSIKEAKEVSLEPKQVSKKRKTMSHTDSKETSTLSKTAKRLKYLIENKPHSSVIVYKGDPGVGKTYFLNKLSENKKYACYNGLTNIKKWLLDQTPGKIKLLLVDEANTFEPGTLDLLYGLKRKSKTITYKGISYPVTPLHKVVAAVNPEYFSGRHYHDLLRLGASTVLARMPKAEDLKKWLMKTYQIDLILAENVLIGASLFKKYRPLAGYSFRDLQNVMLRYILLKKEAMTAASALIILYKALIGEFGITIIKIDEYRQFKMDLAKELKMSLPTDSKIMPKIMVNNYVFPSEMSDAKEAIHQGLLIRQYVCKNSKIAYKRGLVLQGLPGIGKWTLCQQMLKNSGLVEASIDSDILDSQKHYLVVSASESYLKHTEEESYFRYIAKKAFDDGMILVIKNLDLLNPADERFLGGLLTGVHEGKPATHSGFFVFGFKTLHNAQESALSPALCNRMQILQIPSFEQHSWFVMANQQFHNADKARAFVDNFWSPKKPYSRALTGHDFFNCLQKVANPQKQLSTTSTFRLFNSKKHRRSSEIEENGKSKHLKI